MIATVVNAALVLLGGVLGLLLRKKINFRYTDALMMGMAFVVAVIGISGAVKTNDVLGMIVCMATGTLTGELLDIEKWLDRLGEWLRRRFDKSAGTAGTFTQGFVSASLLFCVGSMAIMGALEAGVNHNYTVILSKSVIDCIAAFSMAAALGPGVSFSALSVLAYQGLLTLLAVAVSPYLSQNVVNEMSAVGGVLLMAVAFNMLDLGKKVRVANMLPAMLFPLIYQPIAGLFS